jgi:WD40 repeat protein
MIIIILSLLINYEFLDAAATSSTLKLMPRPNQQQTLVERCIHTIVENPIASGYDPKTLPIDLNNEIKEYAKKIVDPQQGILKFNKICQFPFSSPNYALSNDKRLFTCDISLGPHEEINVWSLSTGQKLGSLKDDEALFDTFFLSHDQKRLFARQTNLSQKICIFDTQNYILEKYAGKERTKKRKESDKNPNEWDLYSGKLILAHNDKLLYEAFPQQINILNIESGENLQKIVESYNYGSIALSDDDKHLFFAASDGIIVCNAYSLECLKKIALPTNKGSLFNFIYNAHTLFVNMSIKKDIESSGPFFYRKEMDDPESIKHTHKDEIFSIDLESGKIKSIIDDHGGGLSLIKENGMTNWGIYFKYRRGMKVFGPDNNWIHDFEHRDIVGMSQDYLLLLGNSHQIYEVDEKFILQNIPLTLSALHVLKMKRHP